MSAKVAAKKDVQLMHGQDIKQKVLPCVFFYGHAHGKPYREFSNFYPSDMELDGQTYWCAEQWIMAEKARMFGDDVCRDKILTCTKQIVIKNLGREVKGYDEKVWSVKREEVALRGLTVKFQSPHLAKVLLATGEAFIVEAAYNDKIWGIGLNEADAKRVTHRTPWTKAGTNLLGRTLVLVRERLRSVANNSKNTAAAAAIDPNASTTTAAGVGGGGGGGGANDVKTSK